MKLPNPQKLVEKFNTGLKQNPKTSLSIMCLLLACSMFLLFGFHHKASSSPLSLLGNLKNTEVEPVALSQNFSIANLLKAREIKNDLEELRAQGLKTKEDTLHMLKIINQFNEIDPSLKKEFVHRIKEENNKHQN